MTRQTETQQLQSSGDTRQGNMLTA